MNVAQLQTMLADAREEFRASRTLRYGIYAIAALLWLYAILVLRDAATAKRESWLGAEARIVRAKALAASGDWATRSTEVKSALADYETLLWKDGSVGLSQASAQESLARSLAAAGLAVRQVRPSVGDSAVSNELSDVLPIRIQASFDFRQPAFHNWLALLGKERAEKRPAFVIDSLTVRGAPTPVVEVVLAAYAVKPGAGK